MKTVAAHFDGKQIVLEEPVKLTAHTKLKVIVAEEGETFSDDDLSQWFLRLSEPAFANVWDTRLALVVRGSPKSSNLRM
jgi:hypothetical protein